MVPGDPSDTGKRPVIFGEVLFDAFPDGSAVLGGAPFNVAWHLKGFGLDPLFISRVGEDAEGATVLRSMEAWGMDCSGVQRDPHRPTGMVRIALDAGHPTFDILPNCAYDRIEAALALSALQDIPPPLLYHGTLAGRSALSRSALQSVRERASFRFMDINLRPPWWERPHLDAQLQGCDWLKLNDTELTALLPGTDEPHAAAAALRQRYSIGVLLLTRGASGAMILDAHGASTVSPQVVPEHELADTVGAGDAFSAVAILGLLRGWPTRRILARATDFAAAVCRVRGAVVEQKGFYTRYLERWNDE